MIRTSCFILVLMALPLLPSVQENGKEDIIVDSAMSREEAIANTAFPKAIVDSQEVVTVEYYSFDNKLHRGQIVVNRLLAEDIRQIFSDIKASHFPIAKVIPIVRYGWSDDASIADNNTSGFNYRRIAGTKRLSDHATGKAIDVNPWLNPWVGRKGVSQRPYKTSVPGTIQRGDAVWTAFTSRGWIWGGSWKNSKDYQHFSKGGRFNGRNASSKK